MIHIIELALHWSHLYNIIICVMKSKRLFKVFGLVLASSMMCVSNANSQDSLEVANEESTEVVETAAEDVVEEVAPIVGDVNAGRQYFEGSKGFLNGGPACITCHNVTNDDLIPGGLLAKDLTDVYDRMGEGITVWLDAPPFPAMISSYQNNPMTEMERTSLTAFLKHANEVKDSQKVSSGTSLFLIGGISGLIGILVLISLLWMKRKKQMVKKDIFARQNSSWDAKH